MNASFNTKHYTYHLGTSLELNSCTTVYYYDSTTIYSRLPTVDGLKASRPSLTFIQDIFINSSTGGIKSYLESTGQFCHRESPKDDFELTEGRTKNPCFDTLIYIGPDGTSVLGFTYFLGKQSNKRGDSIIYDMYLGFKFSIVNKKVDIKVSYTLDPIWSLTDPLLPAYFVTGKSEILKATGPNPETDYMRYTDDLIQLGSEDNFCDVVDGGAITKDSSWRFWIPTPISMTRVREYTRFTVGLWRGSLVLYRWNDDGWYTVDSLSSSNYFGIMNHIKEGQIFYGENETISTFANGVAILDEKLSESDIRESCGYVSIITDNHRYVNRLKKIITDPWSGNDKISIIPNSCTAEDLELRYLLCPPGQYFFLQKKLGPWFKFKNEKSGVVCWANVHGSAYFDAEEEKTVVPWSDRILLSITEDYIDIYSFNYDGISGNKEYLLKDPAPVRVSTDYVSSGGYKPLIDSFRRRPLRPGCLKELHNSCVSFRGLLFYLDNKLKTIYYL